MLSEILGAIELAHALPDPVDRHESLRSLAQKFAIPHEQILHLYVIFYSRNDNYDCF